MTELALHQVCLTFDFDALSVWLGDSPNATPAMLSRGEFGARVGVPRVLELYTINAARIVFQEEDRGSLEVGKLGDFVVLGQDPFEVEPERILEIPVEMTVIGGEVVYRSDGSKEGSA